MNPHQSLLALIDEFLSGRDRSMQLVSEIEGILVDHFLDAEIFESLAEVISLYRPGAGMPYTGEQEMADALSEARTLLEQNSSSSGDA